MDVARRYALLVSLVLVLPVAFAATTLINDINNATANESVSFKGFDVVSSAVADFDGDGIPEIVTQNDNQYLYVLSTTSPQVYAEFRPDYPPNWNVRPLNDPAIADVDGDGFLDIINVNSAGVICDYEYQPGWVFVKRWCFRMDQFGTLGADAGAAVGDVDNDGKMEIFSQTETHGLFALEWNGTLRWAKNWSGGNAGPVITDIDNNGRKEVVFFGDGGEVRVFDASSGTMKWAFYAKNYVDPASIPVAGAIGDVDGDGAAEIVFSARQAPLSQTNYSMNHLMMFVLSHDGKLQSRWQPPWANPLSYTHPVLIDVDGDGVKDILMQDWNTIGHKPGNWEKLGPANVFAYTHNGTLLWRSIRDNSWSNDDLAVADVDGDGEQEVLAIGYDAAGKDSIWYLNLRTGAAEDRVNIGAGWQNLRGPIAGNLDGTGVTSWAVSVSQIGSPAGGWKVFRTNATCNVHFGGWQNEFGCVGNPPLPPPPVPLPPGAFVFNRSAGQTWWVEVNVTPTPHAVQGRDTNGTWVWLDAKSWGKWGGSFQVESGHKVQYRALWGSTWVESCWFTHPGGVSQCLPPPPPPALPDLVLANLTSSPASPVEGDDVTFTARVVNQGAALANASTLRFTLNNVTLADVATPSLAIGANATLQWVGPLAAGNHTVDALADAMGAVAESNETNGRMTLAVNVSQRPPPPPALDLVLMEFIATPESPTDAEPVTLTLRIAAVDADANASVLRILLDGANLSDVATPALAAGANATLQWAGLIGPGAHVLRAIADADRVLNETDRSNNEHELNLTVAAAPPPPPPALPDLVVANLTSAPTSPTEGSNVTLYAEVTNLGGDANATVLRLSLDGETLADIDVAALVAGGSVIVEWTGTIGMGAHVVDAIADAAGLVAEGNETNNAASLELTIAPAPPPTVAPDLVLLDLRVSPESPIDGANVTIRVNVTNAGGDANASTLRILLDGATLVDLATPALAAGTNATLEWNGTLPLGDHTIHAAADATDAIAETNETNNNATTPITVAPAFKVTFKNPRGNMWWVETDVVVTNGTIAGVDARLNGTAWIPLDHKSWGSWAKSFKAIGTIEFRARSERGDIVISAPYTWPR